MTQFLSLFWVAEYNLSEYSANVKMVEGEKGE